MFNPYCPVTPLPAQITVRASDGGIPPRTADIQGLITIRRNQNLTQFEQGEYLVRMAENADVGAAVVTVRATDKDVSWTRTLWGVEYGSGTDDREHNCCQGQL